MLAVAWNFSGERLGFYDWPTGHIMRIGLISNTHWAGSDWDLPSEILHASAGADLILHCGDLECLGVLDYLEAVASVLAVRDYEDPIERGERLSTKSTRIV